jgi:hypothetical protein
MSAHKSERVVMSEFEHLLSPETLSRIEWWRGLSRRARLRELEISERTGRYLQPGDEERWLEDQRMEEKENELKRISNQ